MQEFLDYQNFLHNSHYEEYLKLIEENTQDLIFERHHILPRSMGGSNHESNLVRLTSEEHIKVHELLAQFCKEDDLHKMECAYRFMHHLKKKETPKTIEFWE